MSTTRPLGRREEILRVAASMFADRGFHGVSMDDLGAEMGVSGPALYRHFPGKEAILSEMLVSISGRLLDGAHASVAEGGSAGEILDRLVAFHVEFALTEPDLIAVQFRDLANVPDPGRRSVRRLQREYVQVWVAALVRVYPGVDVGLALSATQAVFGLLNSTPHSRQLGVEQMASLLHDMASAALAEGCRSTLN